mgnify:CR=1 FL=1
MTLDTKKVSKNALLLGVRTLVTVLLNLYVSRLLLLNLGETSFGVYNIVGSIIVVWGSLRGVFASSTQRFLNVASVHADRDYGKRIFSNSLFIHLIIAILFLSLVGGVGLYLVNNVLSIPITGVKSAKIIFIASLLSSTVGVVTTPFDAAVIAHEKMGFYALTSILDVLGKLVIALCIPYVLVNRLVFWGCTYALIAVLIRLLVVSFARIKCPEVVFSISKDKAILKEMGKFAGWNFLGNTSFYIVNEGLNFILNIFWGVALNAARGVAMQVHSGVTSFTSNIMTASDPQICKLYAEGQSEAMMKLFSLSSRSLSLLYILVSAPIIISIKPILVLWLREVPPYTEEMIILLLIHGFLRTFHSPLNSLFFATAKLKAFQLTEIIVRTSTLFLAYLIAKLAQVPPYSVFIVLCGVEFVNIVLVVLVAKSEMSLNITFYLKEIVVPILKVLVILGVLFSSIWLFKVNYEVHWIVLSLLILLLTGIVSLLFGYKNSEQRTLASILKSKLNWK